MELHLKIVGTLLIILAFLHFFFPKYFTWTQELSSLSIMNRQMMYVHSFFIAFVVFLMGLLCLTSSSELLTTTFGKRISLVLGLFWIVRLFVQFFGYSSKVWKGKSFETSVHIVFSVFWIYLGTVFILTYLARQ
jgi:hypothetical protein